MGRPCVFSTDPALLRPPAMNTPTLPDERQIEALERKYDPEMRFRPLPRGSATLVGALLIALSLMGAVLVYAKTRGYPVYARASLREFLRAMVRALLPLMMPVVMDGALGGRSRREVDEMVEEEEAPPTGGMPALLETEVGRSSAAAAAAAV